MDKALAMKIYNVMCDSSGLEKDMMVANQYKAVSEKMVLNEIKPLLKKYKLILVPIKAIATQEGKLTQVVATYKIIDAETGEFEILETVGNGSDTQDKGSGKAWTYAYKCLVQKTFCLFSGEDTDNHHSDDIGKDKEGVKETKVTTQSLIDMAKSKGFSEEDLLKKHEKEHKKISDVKFMKAEIKKAYYEQLSKLPNK